MKNAWRHQLLRTLSMIGPYVGVRFLRNQGVNFHQAHCMLLGRPPRFK